MKNNNVINKEINYDNDRHSNIDNNDDDDNNNNNDSNSS